MARMLLPLLSLLAFVANAQITITNATFPTAGDTLKYSIDANPSSDIQVATPPGGNQTWILTGLSQNQTSQFIYKNANTGINSMSYPGADLVVVGQTGETYYNKTNQAFEVMGYAGADPAGFGLNVITKFQPSILERFAPMNFFDVKTQTSNLTLPISTEQLPDSLFQGAPFIPDSIRIRSNTQRLEVVDGWGTCQIPGGTYPVLRQKRTDYTTTSMDVLVPFLGWIDINQLLGGGGGGGFFGNFLGTDTTVTYRFLNNIAKEEIAVVTMDSDLSTAASVRYKKNTTVATDDLIAPGSANISAYPNPAIERVRFDCVNLPQDRYTLKIFNIIGKAVFRQDYQISGNYSIKVELENFNKGTYLYNLTDSKGNIIGTKRLVVLKP
ncbi:MAG: T9SS type A sorting domain-containing protein [Saprospiraceae bacterium]|nr:T9SS type A sorting domain-containing protein [Saprospiraceae bacterium]